MTDINELRRLAQAATPGPWKACRSHECYEGTYFEIDPEDEAEYAARPFTHIKARAGAVTEAHDLFEFDRKDAEFIAAANPRVMVELLDRLEAAEKERDALRNEIACVKEVEFPRKVQAVADAWKGKCERLEAQCDAAETEALEQARLNGMGSKREAALMAKLEAAEKERDALQAKVEMMEKQEPVAIVDYKRGSCIRWVEYLGWQKIKDGTKLYALPGAKGEEK